ncbi:MAG: hypothetical protein ABI947_02735 [Chloroflexota bacterium]
MSVTASPESHIAEAIFRTLLYADVFNFPMTEAEIHHFLIGAAATADEVRTTLAHSAWLAANITRVDGYCMLAGSAARVDLRQEREVATQALWPVACRYGALLAHLPFVRMVALTGALAMHNAAGSQDDIDYLLITTAGRVWTARLLAVGMVRLAAVVNVKLCPNYVLSEAALLQDRQDMFLAHELAQMIPLTGLPIYKAMRAVNTWADPMLPNAREPFYAEPDSTPHGIGRWLQWVGESLLSGPLGDAFERWEQRRKLRKFEAQLHQVGSSAQLGRDRVKGHFNDYGTPALYKYWQRLERYNLADDPNASQLVQEGASSDKA